MLKFFESISFRYLFGQPFLTGSGSAQDKAVVFVILGVIVHGSTYSLVFENVFFLSHIARLLLIFRVLI